MFYYYGRKKQIVRRYPPPNYDTIVEPFAGAAAYSFHHNSSVKRVILVEKDEKLQKDLITPYSNNQNFLFPIFYNQIKQETIEDLIAGKELFRIAGITPGVNYQL